MGQGIPKYEDLWQAPPHFLQSDLLDNIQALLQMFQQIKQQKRKRES